MELKNRILVTVLAAGIGLGSCWTLAAQQGTQKRWRTKEEYDAYKTFNDAKMPTEKVAALDAWKRGWPDTNFADERDLFYLDAYQKAGMCRETIDKAIELLQKKPTDPLANNAFLSCAPNLLVPGPTPADFINDEKIARYIREHLDDIVSPANIPGGLTAEQSAQWARTTPAAKLAFDVHAQQLLAWIFVQPSHKNDAKAEVEITAFLKMDGTQAQYSDFLGAAMYGQATQADTSKVPLALWHFARAAAYAGPNSLNPASRKSLDGYLTKAYAAYHGSNDGLAELLTMAGTSTFPPAGFAVSPAQPAAPVVSVVPPESVLPRLIAPARPPVSTVPGASGPPTTSSNADPARVRAEADKGNQVAQFNLGIMYVRGQGVPKDNAQALSWFTKAADQGMAEAQYQLGAIYGDGRGVAQDDVQAAAWLRKAADQGLAAAQNYLGIMYAGGTGVPKDEAQAVAWYRKAADQGLAAAQTHLGNMYASGRGVPKDDALAAFWRDKAKAKAAAPQPVARIFIPQNVGQVGEIRPEAVSAIPVPLAAPTGPAQGVLPDGVYKIGGGVSAPVPTYQPEPEYSREARVGLLTGTVRLKLVVDESGNPRNISVTRPLGMGLDEKAMDAVEKWRFQPAQKDGRPVPVEALIDVAFHLL